MTHIQGPDFPTGGVIMGKSGIRLSLIHIWIQFMLKEMNVPVSVSQCGVDRTEYFNAIDSMAEKALADACTCLLYTSRHTLSLLFIIF